MGITTTEQQDAITQFAIRANLLKQAAITGSPLTSIGSPTPMNMAYAGMNNPINVYVQGSVISERDLVKLISDAQKKNTFAGTPVSGTYLGTGSDTLAFKVRYL
jgi:alpha-D-ribose 1-methylphosphonate 5-phosphate C-P lyase